MSTNRNRNLATFLLVLGAVVFGMVLAGGLQLTVPSQAADQDPPSRVESQACHAERVSGSERQLRAAAGTQTGGDLF